jgi:hypothetical protein
MKGFLRIPPLHRPNVLSRTFALAFLLPAPQFESMCDSLCLEVPFMNQTP